MAGWNRTTALGPGPPHSGDDRDVGPGLRLWAMAGRGVCGNGIDVVWNSGLRALLEAGATGGGVDCGQGGSGQGRRTVRRQGRWLDGGSLTLASDHARGDCLSRRVGADALPPVSHGAGMWKPAPGVHLRGNRAVGARASCGCSCFERGTSPIALGCHWTGCNAPEGRFGWPFRRERRWNYRSCRVRHGRAPCVRQQEGAVGKGQALCRMTSWSRFLPSSGTLVSSPRRNGIL